MDLAVGGALPADAVHLLPDLLKAVQGAGVLHEDLVVVVLQPQVGQIDQPRVGGPADALLHGLGVPHPGAQGADGQVPGLRVLRQIADQLHDVPAARRPQDPNPPQKVLRPLARAGGGAGLRRRGGGGRPGLGHPLHQGVDLGEGVAHGHGLAHPADHALHLDGVDGLVQEKLDTAAVGLGHHVLGRDLGEHDVGGLGQELPGPPHEGDPVHLRHEQVHHHDVRAQGGQVLQGVRRALRGAADLPQSPVVDDDLQDVEDAGAVVDQIESHGDTSRDVVGIERMNEVLPPSVSTRRAPWSSRSVRSRTRHRPIPRPTRPVA